MSLVKFNNQDYYKIKSKCRSEGKLFTDAMFPANDSVLFKSKRIPNVQWKRPHVCIFQ
jgi:hypothetical protein